MMSAWAAGGGLVERARQSLVEPVAWGSYSDPPSHPKRMRGRGSLFGKENMEWCIALSWSAPSAQSFSTFGLPAFGVGLAPFSQVLSGFRRLRI